MASLDLSGNNLAGLIPSELSNLASLTKLNLWYNALVGPIPPELGNLGKLRYLDLGANQLTGSIPPELGNLVNLGFLVLRRNELTGPIPAELGNLGNLYHLRLGENGISGPIPPELGSLGKLGYLNLSWSRLSGPIPAELGSLDRLRTLFLNSTRLEGPIPHSFLRLDRLGSFQVQNSSICVPGGSAFAEWLRGIEYHDAGEAPSCNAADVAALEALFEATGGTGWTDSRGWLSDSDVAQWHGVSVDSLGAVIAIDLARNGLTGKLPATMGDLRGLTELRIGGNPITGPLPLSLARLPLRGLHYAETGLCAPTLATFQAWLTTIASHDGTGALCAPLSDRDILKAFYDAAGGPNWTNRDNWLTNAPLGQWRGVTANAQGHVTGIRLGGNSLSGPIPAELGGVADLEALDLSGNRLSGPIPPELGGLASLRSLDLGSNELSGPIPAELGGVADLETLYLSGKPSIRPDPGRIGRPCQSALAAPRVERTVGSDPGRTRWCRRPGNVVPLWKPSIRPDPA